MNAEVVLVEKKITTARITDSEKLQKLNRTLMKIMV